MRIVDGKKYLKKEIDGCVEIDGKGWDSYDGRNMQWYRLKYNPECDLVILDADNSGNYHGTYNTWYFTSPEAFKYWCEDSERDWSELLGDVDEENAAAVQFVARILGEDEKTRQPKSAATKEKHMDEPEMDI